MTSFAHAENATSPASNPGTLNVTEGECAVWRAKLSGGQVLTDDERSKFVHCIPSGGGGGIAPGVEAIVPPDKSVLEFGPRRGICMGSDC